MICHRCQERQAIMQLQVRVNGMLHEQQLCGQCARELGVGGEVAPAMAALLSGLLGLQDKASKIEACPLCGATSRQLTQTGRVGCTQCYTVFQPILKPYIMQIHGQAEHNGRTPGRVSGELKLKRERRQMEQRMQKAVEEQEYEEAARIRDLLKEMH